MRQRDLWLGYLYNMMFLQKTREEEVDHLLTLSKVNRHDTLNSMQIIWGWIQLEKPEKAIEYIKEWQADIIRQSVITKNLNQHLAGWYMHSQAKAALEGVRFQYIGEPSDLEIEIPYFTDLLNLVVESLLQLLKTLTCERDIFWSIEEQNKDIVFLVPNIKMAKSDVDPMVEKLKLDENVFINSLVWQEENKATAKWFGYSVELNRDKQWVHEGQHRTGVQVLIKLVRSEDCVY